MKQIRFLILSLLLLCCSKAVVAGMFSLTPQQEVAIGVAEAKKVERTQPIIQDEKVTDYVVRAGRKLVQSSKRPDQQYRFRVIDSKEVNAFALPGGFIYINRGLIENAETENEFVGVLAHEISHVVGRHSAEQIEKAQKANLLMNGAGLLFGRSQGGRTLLNLSQYVGKGLFLKFSRDAEREADRLGAENMFTAGWNPTGMVSFFQKLAAKGNTGVAFFSTHPSPQERQSNISDLISQLGTKGTVDSKEYQEIRTRLASMPRRK